MSIPAYLDKSRRSQRRKLHLQLKGAKATGLQMRVLVHNISETGLLIESETPLAIDEGIDIDLPHAGATSARVIWSSGPIYGCQFDTAVSPATLSAAQLRSIGEPDIGMPRHGAADSFGARLHSLRVAKGLTQSQLAAELGVSEPSISAWEKDKSRPKAGRMDALSESLGVEMAELLGISEPRSLGDAVDEARTLIAQAAGIEPDQVKINIEL